MSQWHVVHVSLLACTVLLDHQNTFFVMSHALWQ